MQATGIGGAYIFTPRIYPDNRGTFNEWFRASEFQQDLGYRFDLAQANCSVSQRGVIRGIHFTDVPPGQAKYVTCASGSVLDVIVDVRIGSPTYLRWAAVPLDDEARRGVFLSEGLGHGFVALSPQAVVMYLCSTGYAPGIEHGVNPLDPEIGIAWPGEAEFILSEKDAAAPSVREARQAGLLPIYTDCMDFAVRQREPSLPGGPHD
ncbi:MAG: dTDP-4-dehydrorhamnose 3,5-epimerase [Streptosporangiaceae bacterium]